MTGRAHICLTATRGPNNEGLRNVVLFLPIAAIEDSPPNLVQKARSVVWDSGGGVHYVLESVSAILDTIADARK